MSIYIRDGSGNSFTNIKTDGTITVVGETNLTFQDAVAREFHFESLSAADVSDIRALASDSTRDLLLQILERHRAGVSPEQLVRDHEKDLASRGIDVGKLLSTVGGAVNFIAAIARVLG